MIPERFQRLESLFFEARQLDHERRTELLARCRNEDPELAQELEALLETSRVDADADLDVLFGSTRREEGGTTPEVPDYEIVREIGCGGQGRVYEARALRTGRRVALKVLFAGADEPGGLHRFQREVESLARLRHEAIVTVLDSGILPSGRAYLVMDHVEGRPLDQVTFADRDALLRTFLTVCEAVAHAHARGILHRDLKPSNLRIDERGNVHVLDFGLARSLDLEEGRPTRTGGLRGTPAYMAPEQVRGGVDAIDVRVDVYALGVVLYRLASGRDPYPVDGDLLETLRHVCETEPRSLRGHVDSEIEAIALRALAKDPERRYATVAALGDDVRRALHGEPLQTPVPRSLYRLRKFVWRHRVAVAIALAFTTLILISLLVISQLYHQESIARANAEDARRESERQRDVAEEERMVATTIQRFLHRYVLAPVSPRFEPDRDLTLREVLQRFTAGFAPEFQIHPKVQAALHHTLGLIRWNLGDLERAEEHARSGLALCREHDFTATRHARELELLLAIVLRSRERFEEAEDLSFGLQDWSARTLAPEDPLALSILQNLAALDDARGRLEQSRSRYREIATRARFTGQTRTEWTARNNLAQTYSMHRDYERAEELLSELENDMRDEVEETDPLRLTVRHNLAHLLQERGRFEEALPMLRELAEARRAGLGERDPGTLATLDSLGACQIRLGRFEAAEVSLRQAFEGRRERLGPDHERTLDSQCHLAQALVRLERSAEAERLLVDAVERSRDRGQKALAPRNDLAFLYLEEERYAEARERLQATMELEWVREHPDHPTTLTVLGNLALATRKLERLDEARVLYERVVAGHERTLPTGHPNTIIARLNFARCLDAAREFDDAQTQYERAFDELSILLPASHWLHGLALFYRGEHHLERHALDRARADLERADAVLRETFPEEHERVIRIKRALEALREREHDEEGRGTRKRAP